jgi:hypothetical protein
MRPSGSQATGPSPSAVRVSWRRSLPSASITYTSKFPERSEPKASRLPSGDQAPG